jgi:hypothetical protein
MPAGRFGVVVDDCLEFRTVGFGGGGIDPLLAAMLGLVVEDCRVEEGVVFVRGVEAPEVAADPNCFVGDFVGDYTSFSIFQMPQLLLKWTYS